MLPKFFPLKSSPVFEAIQRILFSGCATVRKHNSILDSPPYHIGSGATFSSFGVFLCVWGGGGGRGRGLDDKKYVVLFMRPLEK